MTGTSRDTVAALALLTAAWPAFGQARADGDFVELLAGSFDGWTVEGDANAAMNAGTLRVEAPQGWIKSAGRYTDFALRVEFRFLTDDADSGIFIRTEGTSTFARGWPGASYQVQLRNPVGRSPFPPVGGIFRHGLPPGPTEFDERAAHAASRPTGEWQTLEVEVGGETLAVTLNGVRLTSASGIERRTGHIGIQAETGTLEFRSIAIAERTP